MTWENQPATESRGGHPEKQFGQERNHAGGGQSNGIRDKGAAENLAGARPQLPLVTIGKKSLPGSGGKDDQVFTMTLGQQTIELLPLRNWGQLDLHKWSVQGKLPGTPSGLEITADHVKIIGETVPINDPQGCERLEKLFNEWLTLENSNLALGHSKLKPRASAATTSAPPELKPGPTGLRFQVEIDKRGQVHVVCLRGAERAASIGLTIQGFNGLFSEGLMRKPRSLDVGALHDWVELDGELCSFEHGNNDARKLESLLNERYVPVRAPGQGKDILIFANAASATGFDIQFPATMGGVPENRRRPLNDAALELLLEPKRCGLLQPGLIIKLSPPTLIFKCKTPDGGEAYLPKSPANLVTLSADDGRARQIDLSLPVNYSRLSVVEMTAIFNHPAIHRHSKVSEPSGTQAGAELNYAPPEAPPHAIAVSSPEPKPQVCPQEPRPLEPPSLAPVESSLPAETPPALVPPVAAPEEPSVSKPAPQPNACLKEILSRTPIRFDWLSCLIYARLAQRFGNSQESMFGPSKCWSVALGDTKDLEAPDFKGFFLTQKGGFGFLGHGQLVRFHRGVAFLGTRQAVLEGIAINLVAVGLDDEDRPQFIVCDGYAARFGADEQLVKQELLKLHEAGASLLGVSEALQLPRALRVVWSVPADQARVTDPEVVESAPI